jgi:DNA-binding SARP family transcriptional activator
MIEIRTLGALEVRDIALDRPVAALQHPRPLALLVRLALQEGPVRRDTLLPHFWPESDEHRARHALRQLVLRVRRALGAGVLVSHNSEALQLRHDRVRCDAVLLRQAVRQGRRQEALDLYAGEFMAGFHLPGAPDFGEWLERERDQLRAAVAGAAQTLMEEAAAARRFGDAARLGERVLELAPYDEACWREYLLLLTRAGQGARALLLYQRLVGRLEAELGLAPSAATLALARTLWPQEPAAPQDPPVRIAVAALERADAADPWRELQARAETLSRRTLDAVRRRSGLPFELTLTRHCCARHLARFLHSGATATAFIGPAGAGKSIALAHAAERLWLGPSAAYPDDILWYVQAEDLHSLSDRGFDLLRWLRAQLGFGDDADVRTFFDATPAARGGRVVLVLDGLDAHALDIRTLDALTGQVLDVVASNRHSWFRVIVAMRAGGWQRLASRVEYGSALARAWYGVSWVADEEEFRNVPPLRPAEVRRLVRRCWRAPPPTAATLETLASSRLLTEPGYLQLVLQAGSPAAPVDECRLVEQYLDSRVLAGPGGPARAEVLADYVRSGRYGRVPSVERSRLCAGEPRRTAGCDELLRLGVLRERQQRGRDGLPVATVTTGQPQVLDYLIVRHSVADDGLTPRMLRRLATHCGDSVHRVPLLEWAVRLALREGAWPALEGIFELRLHPHELENLSRSVGVLLRQHDRARAWLLPRWAERDSGRRHYFETFVDQDYLVLQLTEHLPCYIAAARHRQALVFGHAMMLLGSLLRLDPAAAVDHRAALDRLAPDTDIHPLPLGRAMAYRLLCHHIVDGAIPATLLDGAVRIAALPLRAPDRFASFPVYQLFLMEALNLCGMPDVTLDVARCARRLFPELDAYRDRTVFYRLLLTHEAMALALAGRTDEARGALRACTLERTLNDPQSYPSFHYATLHHRLAAAEIDDRTGRTASAMRRLQLVVDTSRSLGFVLFEKLALDHLSRLRAGTWGQPVC